MKNKHNRTREIKRLHRECWALCHEIVNLRDGRKCQLCDRSDALDLDHGISRNNKNIFYDVRHLGYLCRGIGGHHPAKSFAPNGPVAKLVDLVHIKREGLEVWEELNRLAKINCHDYNKVWYLEQVLIELKSQRAELLEKQWVWNGR